MCGLFGAIRCSDPAHAALVVDVVMALGVQSEERGVDSAGLTMIVAGAGHREVTTPTETHTGSRVAGMDQTFTVKDEGKFSNIDFVPYLAVMDRPTLFIGHTRWATQGTTNNLANASPMYSGSLIATHNGDVETATIPRHRSLEVAAFGETDSELLFLALNSVRDDRRGMTKVLRTVHGRAALAFYDRSRPNRLYLARTGLAPLSYAYDQYDNFYYASNPDWFRRIARKNPDVVFSGITLIPEGHLLTVNTLTGAISDVRRFTPTVRESDMNLMNLAAYRGFTAEDKAVDIQLHRHRIVQPPMGKWPTLAAVPLVLPAKDEPAVSPQRTATGGNGWSMNMTDYYAQKHARENSGAVYPHIPSVSISDIYAGSHGLDARFDAEEAEVWEQSDALLDEELNAVSDYSIFERDGVYDDEEITRLSEEYDNLDWQEVEDLCWNRSKNGQFDHFMYNKIFDADPEDALQLIRQLREDVPLNDED